MARTARLFVVSGPSGVGKGTLVARVRAKRPDLGLTVSATTRTPRAGEVEGISYYYLTEDEFSARVAAGKFVEWANVHGHRYGTLKSEVERNLTQGRSLILEIDVQGGLNVRNSYEDVVLVFIAPPSMEELRHRLEGRGTDSAQTIEARLQRAREEYAEANFYDYIIINDDVEAAAGELDAIITAEHCRAEDRMDVLRRS